MGVTLFSDGGWGGGGGDGGKRFIFCNQDSCHMMVPESEVPKKAVGMLVTGAEVSKNLPGQHRFQISHSKSEEQKLHS